MRRLSAQYIFDGIQYHKLAVVVLDEQNKVIELEKNHEPYVERAGVEFYNGVIFYDKQKDNSVILCEHFDFQQIQKKEYQ
jgi:hypothetical protein